jgi:hypothetical protein
LRDSQLRHAECGQRERQTKGGFECATLHAGNS